MRGKKKKSIEELEKELAELIKKSGRSEQDIQTYHNDYRALKKRIDNPNSLHDDDDVRRMKELYDPFLLGETILNKQKKIRAARKAVAATAATTTATATSNVANNSISSSATLADSSPSTSINVNEITASFESTPPPSSDPSTTLSLPSSNDKTSRASLDINSLSDQSSILASRSINEITASFEANASFALSTSRLNASKRPRLASQQQSGVVVDLSNECSIWSPHQRLLSSNVTIMDFPGDGNCLFQACISKLESCSSVTTEQARIMRNNLMEYLLCHADEPSGDSTSLTWRNLAMMHAPEIKDEMIRKGFF
jgi:hypothetical protein